MGRAFTIALIFIAMASNVLADEFEVAPPVGNWNKVQGLLLNSNITIELKQGGKMDGAFMRLTEDSVYLKEYVREEAYAKADILRVYWMRPGSRARNAAILGGILFGIGFGVGYAAAPKAADQNNMPAGERAAAGAAIGGLLGGAAALISLAHRPGPRSEVIYRSR